ncbi:MAG: phosphoribosylamine--glycine ligase [Flavobacteriales bacterium]|nr:phosphoribosylamine--glycine ligase [Flavobacteriales bacterium]
MNVLVLGSGGREHAFCWKLSQSSLLDKLYAAPGNSGTALHATNVPLKLDNFAKIAGFIKENEIDIVVVGPEVPLVNGLHDYLAKKKDSQQVTVIGPKKAGAMLEGSKDVAKTFMNKYHIPCARSKTFDKASLKEGLAFIDSTKGPYVLKADGLAAGKGVVILDDQKEAKAELKAMISDSKFGKASAKVVVEQFLKGTELSVFVLTDGRNYKLLPTAKDYKRIGEKDTGLNTGGMGAISPAPSADELFMKRVEEQVIIPTLRGLESEGMEYQGFIFFGLMDVKGNPHVIEYNVRMGDPETEIVLPRIQSDLLDLFEGIRSGTFSEKDLQISEKEGATVVLVSGGYPEKYAKGKTITGMDDTEKVHVFHAGMKLKENSFVTNGGRVMAVSATSRTTEKALRTIYKEIEKLKYSKMYYRKDIGYEILDPILN